MAESDQGHACTHRSVSTGEILLAKRKINPRLALGVNFGRCLCGPGGGDDGQPSGQPLSEDERDISILLKVRVTGSKSEACLIRSHCFDLIWVADGAYEAKDQGEKDAK